MTRRGATGGGSAGVGAYVSGGTSGSILFVSSAGTIAQDNAKLFWDDTNNRLGIGTASPSTILDVYTDASNYVRVNAGYVDIVRTTRTLRVDAAGISGGTVSSAHPSGLCLGGTLDAAHVKIDSSGNTTMTAFFQESVTAAITASTTQTQGNGALTKGVNEVSVCANANDTVTLPAAVAGRIVRIINNGAATLQIFPASGDNLGAGVDASTTLNTATNRTFVAYDATNWEVF